MPTYVNASVGRREDDEIDSMAKPTFDIISVGDATLDIFVRISEASVVCSIDKSACVLCLNYADKIPIERLDRTVAGNAANNAVGSARLGMKTSFYSIVGDDETGIAVVKTMKKEGVSLKHLQIDKAHSSNYSVVINFQGERTILTHSEPRKYVAPHLMTSEWIYFTAVGKNHERLEKHILSHCRKTGTKLAFNPGTSQLREGLKRLSPTLKQTDVLFVNKEEGQMIVGPHLEMKGLLIALKETGPKIVVVTDAANGAAAYNGKEMFTIGIYPMPKVETTGAGDSFATAFLAALHYGKTISEALQWGAADSGSVVGKIGPQAGLLHREELEKIMKKYTRIKPLSLG